MVKISLQDFALFSSLYGIALILLGVIIGIKMASHIYNRSMN